MSDEQQRLFFYPSDYNHRKVGVYIERLGVVDGAIYVYFPHIPVKILERPRPVRVALKALEPAEFDLLNDAGPSDRVDGDGPQWSPRVGVLPTIEIPTYLRPKPTPRSNRRLFQQDFRAPVTLYGAKGQEIHSVTTVRFIQDHTRDEDPSPKVFSDQQRHMYYLHEAEDGERVAGLIRGAKDRELWRLEHDESHAMLQAALDFKGGDDLDQLAELRLRFILMEQSAVTYRKWTGLSERYLAHLDRYIRRWWKGTMYPRSENGLLTRIPGKKPRNADRTIRMGIKSGRIPAESVV